MSDPQLVLHTCRRWRPEFDGAATMECESCGHTVAFTPDVLESRRAYCNAVGAELRVVCDECMVDKAVESKGPVVVYVPPPADAGKPDLSGSIPVERINERLTEDELRQVHEGIERELLGRGGQEGNYAREGLDTRAARERDEVRPVSEVPCAADGLDDRGDPPERQDDSDAHDRVLGRAVEAPSVEADDDECACGRHHVCHEHIGDGR